MAGSKDKVLLINHEVYGLAVRKKVKNYYKKFIFISKRKQAPEAMFFS